MSLPEGVEVLSMDSILKMKPSILAKFIRVSNLLITFPENLLHDKVAELIKPSESAELTEPLNAAGLTALAIPNLYRLVTDKRMRSRFPNDFDAGLLDTSTRKKILHLYRDSNSLCLPITEGARRSSGLVVGRIMREGWEAQPSLLDSYYKTDPDY